MDARKTCIRLRFNWLGKRRAEKLNLAPTQANIRAAERLLAQINREIQCGVFNYAETFPESKKAQANLAFGENITVREFARLWLPTLRGARSTVGCYTDDINNFWLNARVGPADADSLLGDMAVRSVLPMHIQRALSDKAKTGVSPKRLNNLLDPVRKMFNDAVANRVTQKSPVAAVSNEKVQRDDPDPFDSDEMEKILGYMRKRQPEVIYNYFAFAFATGMRTSELIAVRWGDVDFRRSQVKVQRARVRHRDKETKTYKPRTVDLNERAMAALVAQKKFTFLRGPDHPIFCEPRGPAWRSERRQRIAYFHPALKACGIRKRDARVTRHTFCSLMLTAGAAPAWIAGQTGHSVQTLLKNYARWLPEGTRVELAKANAVFRAPGLLVVDSGPELVPQDQSGRK